MKKAKQQGMNLFEAAEQAAVHATFPAASDWDACVAFYRAQIVKYDSAMLQGDTDEAIAVREYAAELVGHLYGPKDSRNPRWSCWMDCADELEQATAAPDGIVPMWGQSGSFVLDLAAPTRIELDGMLCICYFSSLLAHFSINVVEPLRNFYSETGYRSCFSGLRFAQQGMTLEAAIRTYVQAYFKGEMKGRLVKLQDRYIDRKLGRPERDHYDDDGSGRSLSQRAAEAEDDDEETDEPGFCDECGRAAEDCFCYDDEDESEMAVAA